MTIGNIAYGLTALLYIVAVYNCYTILGDRRSSASSAAWILLNLGFPFLGVPLYFVLGQSRLRGYASRHSRVADYDEIHLPDVNTGLVESIELAGNPQFEDFNKIFSRYGIVYEPRLGKAELLIDGVNTFEAIFAAIKEAKHYIVVQYYVLRNDRLGLELKELLKDKAKEGVPVYLLYDDMGSFWLPRRYIRDLESVGVKTARFLPVTSASRFFQLNFRNHRKLVVVDGRIGFTGGLNVGEEYATKYFQRDRSASRYWRDTHIKVTGPTVQMLTEIFIDDWAFATGAKPQIPEVETVVSAEVGDPDCFPIQVIPTGPSDKDLISILLVMQMIHSAKERLWIATPYFIPDTSIVRALELAVLRGVDVRILIPLKGDSTFVHWVSMSYAEQIAQKGVKVCLYQKGFMHQKVFLVDDSFTAIGTMNLDMRALYLNFETTVLLHNKVFNSATATLLESDFVESCYFKEDNSQLIQRLKRLRAGAARLAAPLL